MAIDGSKEVSNEKKKTKIEFRVTIIHVIVDMY